MNTAAAPVSIKKIGSKELKLAWADSHESVYGFRYLRQNCQCAMCIEEWTGKAILERDSVPKDLEGLKVSVVGNYALGMTFSDGHSTGLFTFTHLRKICPCAECTAAEPTEATAKTYLEKGDLKTRVD